MFNFAKNHNNENISLSNFSGHIADLLLVMSKTLCSLSRIIRDFRACLTHFTAPTAYNYLSGGLLCEYQPD